jgi:hypothetical protein
MGSAMFLARRAPSRTKWIPGLLPMLRTTGALT